jgi:hypothetical protein
MDDKLNKRELRKILIEKMKENPKIIIDYSYEINQT